MMVKMILSAKMIKPRPSISRIPAKVCTAMSTLLSFFIGAANMLKSLENPKILPSKGIVRARVSKIDFLLFNNQSLCIMPWWLRIHPDCMIFGKRLACTTKSRLFLYKQFLLPAS